MKVLIRFPADHNMLSFLALAMPIPLDFTTLREALEADPYTKQFTANLASDPSSHPDSPWLQTIFINNLD